MKKIISVLSFVFLFQFSFSQVKLPALIRDSMILQRDAKIKIWGWASPNEKIKISFNKKTFKTKADANGNWNLFLPAMKAGGPYTMKIDAGNHITLKDILIGDVWLCAGQSNMVLQIHEMADSPSQLYTPNTLSNQSCHFLQLIHKVYPEQIHLYQNCWSHE